MRHQDDDRRDRTGDPADTPEAERLASQRLAPDGPDGMTSRGGDTAIDEPTGLTDRGSGETAGYVGGLASGVPGAAGARQLQTDDAEADANMAQSDR